VVTAKKRNVRGGNNDPARGSWCTEKRIAVAVGPRDLDPFSNPRSHIIAARTCMLENGGDGFGDGETPGSYKCGGEVPEYGVADENTSTWFQPDYRKGFVMRAFNHYAHTRYTALLRFDPRPDWFKRVYAASELVCVLWECNFEPPPGVDDPGSTFPHALFYRYAADVTNEVLRMSISWRKKTNG
jgi:hypothetical protein